MQPAVTTAAHIHQGAGPGVDKDKAVTLYLHIPFCTKKCNYCSFTSYPTRGRNLDAYLEALQLEMGRIAKSPWLSGHRFTSMFIGGGTPTVYGGPELARLVTNALRLFSFAEQPEITVEANPNSLDTGKLEALLAAGVNRLSIGIQSFSDPLLTTIGRLHTSAEAIHAFELARQAGFANISLDLIYGLPGQKVDDWLATLATAMRLEPQHISAYELMVEEQTPLAAALARRELMLPDDEEVVTMAEKTVEWLADQGYERYEISHYSAPAFCCRHNIHYWENRSYIGCGAGAVSGFAGLRLVTLREPAQYMQALQSGSFPYMEGECLAREGRFRETVIMGLRMLKGVSIDELELRFGINAMEYYGARLTGLVKQNLVLIENGWIRLSRKGLVIANRVLTELV